MRTSFGRSYPEHDPWLFDTTRLVESGEIDCALWISAYRTATPEWTRSIPTIVLTRRGLISRPLAQVAIEVGRPGIDRGQYASATDALAPITATKPGHAGGESPF